LVFLIHTELRCTVNHTSDLKNYPKAHLVVTASYITRVKFYETLKVLPISNLLHRVYWIIGRKSILSLENKLLIYKTIPKPIWTYGIPLWRTASNSNIEILQRFQNEVIRSIVNAPWYVPKTILQIPTVKTEITNFSTKYREKLNTHPNELIPAHTRPTRRRRTKKIKTFQTN